MFPLIDLLHIATGVLLFAIVLRFAVLQANAAEPRASTGDSIRFFLLVLASLFVWQAPILFLNVEIGGDESLMLAQAMKFKTDFLPWRSVDGTTSGPLNSYALMWPFLFGLKVSHFTARLTVLACDFIALFFAQKAFSRVVNPARSFLAVIPILAFFLLSHKQEFVDTQVFICLSQSFPLPSGLRSRLIKIPAIPLFFSWGSCSGRSR